MKLIYFLLAVAMICLLPVDAKIRPDMINNTGEVNIMDFGAKGNLVANDTVAIQNAIDSMSSGDCLVVPGGNYSVSSITFAPPDDCSMRCYGRLVNRTSTGSVIIIGKSDADQVSRRYTIQGLRVISNGIDWTTGRIGIDIRNVQESYIDIRDVEGFNTNILMNGRDGEGCAYNEIHLGLVYNAKIGLELTRGLITEGSWTNENSIYGGRFSIQSTGIPDYTGTVHVEVGENTNNNRFYNPSFEGDEATIPMSIHGIYIYVYSPRIEGVGNLTLEADSSYSVVFYGRGVYLSDRGTEDRVTDLGICNQIYSPLGVKLTSYSSAVDPLTLKPVNSAYRALSVQNSTGVEHGFITGNGVLGMSEGLSAPSAATGFALIYIDTSNRPSVKFSNGTVKHFNLS